MAIAIDASTPARVNLSHPGGGSDDPSGTTASFSPPAGARMLASIACDTNTGVTPTFTVTDSAGESWSFINSRVASDSGATSGCVAHYIAPATLGTSRTVTVTVNNMGVTRSTTTSGSFKLWVITDALFTWGAVGEASSTTNAYTATNILTGVLSTSLVFGTGGDWNALGSPTSSDLTEDAFTNSFYSGLHGYKAAGAGGNISMNFDASGASAADWNVCAVEIQQASGGGGTPAIRKWNSIPSGPTRVGGLKALFQGGLWLPGRSRPVSMYQPRPVLAEKKLILPAWAAA